MKSSWIAMHRALLRQVSKDAAVRRSIELSGRPLLTHAETLTDEEAIARLADLGAHVDRARLDDASRKLLSAEQFVQPFLDALPKRRGRFDEDWVWILVLTLWHRWFPDRPTVEMLDDKMQEGYRLDREQRVRECADLWLSAWRDLLRIAERGGLRRMGDLDEGLQTTQFVSNWVQDLDMILQNAGREDSRFFQERMALAREYLNLFPEEGSEDTQAMRRALAESHFDLGEIESGEALFRQYLEEDPEWGWGWIAWSDAHYLFAREEWRDSVKAESILKQGLAVSGVRDRPELLDRLATLYSETGRAEEAAAVREERARLFREERDAGSGRWPIHVSAGPRVPVGDVDGFAPEPLRREAPKVGRNDPCPCGSGKKHKKCCGA